MDPYAPPPPLPRTTRTPRARMAAHDGAGGRVAGAQPAPGFVVGSSASAAAAGDIDRQQRPMLPPAVVQPPAPTAPTQCANATGAINPPPPSYPTSSSVHTSWAPPPLFASHPSYADAPQYTMPYKSPPTLPQPPSALPYASYLYSSAQAYANRTMAISPANNARYVQSYASSSTPASTSAEGAATRAQNVATPAELARNEPDEPNRSEGDEGDEEAAPTDAPAKKNPCIMCHKSFDRPSTLKKHLLVHTGEKAHECPDCHRRFSVASNLRRHRTKCPARSSAEPGTSAAAGPSTRASVPAPAQPSTSAAAVPAAAPEPRGRKRPSDAAEASPSASTSAVASTSTATSTHAPRPKRRRRAPSPAHWIPESLLVFDLTPYAKSTPVPLPPVEPCSDDERDSFDTSVGEKPYHPSQWRGRLPGPALLEPESMGGMGARMLVI